MNMKKYFLVLALGLMGLGTQSCDNDDDNIKVSAELQNAFNTKYPNMTPTGWESKQGYYVADFRDGKYEAEAWFSADGTWQMTETDVPYSSLPAAVRNAFEAGDYAAWRVEDVDKVERRDAETVYVIEVESGEQEVDLYYTEDGILVKEVADTDGNDNNYLPSDVSNAVTTFINENYPGARIVETDQERGMTEVDIIHNGVAKEVLFNADGSWVSTSWDVRRADVPQVVTDAALAAHAGYVVDDVDFVETPAGSYYLLELEKNGAPDVYVKVQADGTVLG